MTPSFDIPGMAGNETRIRQWFSHFQMSKLSEFGYGAKALASYALNNRDNVRLTTMSRALTADKLYRFPRLPVWL